MAGRIIIPDPKPNWILGHQKQPSPWSSDRQKQCRATKTPFQKQLLLACAGGAGGAGGARGRGYSAPCGGWLGGCVGGGAEYGPVWDW